MIRGVYTSAAAVALTIMCVMSLLAPSARAQQPADAGQTGSADGIETVVVTGTRIREPRLFSASPLATLDAGEIKAYGAFRIEDVLNQLPQIVPDQSATVNNGATGTATADLRGLFPERTLVLIDGKRLMPGDPTSGSVAPDLNMIPAALVERIDVVTGGQSAVYGSDAIAGVVNFLMKRDFTGLRLDATAGIYNNNNRNSIANSALAASNTGLPLRDAWDGPAGDLTVSAGMDSDDGHGNASAYFDYRRSAAITQDNRDYSACALESDGDTLFCQGSPRATALGHFTVVNPATHETVSVLTLDPTGLGDTLRPFNPPRDAFDFAPYQYFQRPDERYAAGTFAHYTFSDAIEVYADAMYMKDKTTGQIAPSGLFSFPPPYRLSCSNPLFSADEVAKFCTAAVVPANGVTAIIIGRRNVEGGGRETALTHSDYRLLGGVRGDIADWHYDVSAQYGAVDVTQLSLHDVLLSHAADALDVVRDSSGNIVCASGNPGCVPYDIFSIGGVTKEALAYLDARAESRGTTGETVVSANVTGRLDRYGVVSPWAAEAVSLAFGAEYRREGLSYSPDKVLFSGDLASSPSPADPVSGGFDVKEVYGEFRVPIVQGDSLFLASLALEGGYRLSWYSRAGKAETYKIGLGWSPIDDLSLRTSFNRAVRAPNVDDLFTPQTFSSEGFEVDPCAGPDPLANDPLATPANCARTGVSAAQYGHIVESPGQSYNAISGGNPNLKPEAADTFTLGLVYRPKFAPGLQVSIDYYDIDINKAIWSFGGSAELERCLEPGGGFFCNLIHRSPGSGSLWISTDGYVTTILQNAAQFTAKGIDLDTTYGLELPDLWGAKMGDCVLRLLGTYTMKHAFVGTPGGSEIDCAGFFGGESCYYALPKWRHTLRATWQAPENIGLTLTWRYIAAVRDSNSSSNPTQAAPFNSADAKLGSRSYIDVSLDWRIDEHLQARMGVNNLSDRDPPLAGSTALGDNGNGNTYANVYDSLGRWMFVGLTVIP